MGCLLNPLIILLAVIGLVAAVILLGLTAITSSVTALSNSFAVLTSQCVMGLLVIGAFAVTGSLLALRQPIVQALLITRFKLPIDQLNAAQNVPALPDYAAQAPSQLGWSEPAVQQPIEPATSRALLVATRAPSQTHAHDRCQGIEGLGLVTQAARRTRHDEPPTGQRFDFPGRVARAERSGVLERSLRLCAGLALV